MDEKTIAVVILVIVAAIAACGSIIIYKNSTSMAIYEQPANNKPPFIISSQFIKDFNICKQYVCPTEVLGGAFAGEGSEAVPVAYDSWTGNTICSCPNGKTFHVRSDRIEVETY
jgi:hypothetical protein